MKVLIILVVLFMGCALDQDYNNTGLWESNLIDVNFLSNDTISITRNDYTYEYLYIIENRSIFIFKDNVYKRKYRVINWTGDQLIIRDIDTLSNYLLFRVSDI